MCIAAEAGTSHAATEKGNRMNKEPGGREECRNVIGPGALDTISSFCWLENAHRHARAGKRYRDETMKFTANLERNLLEIQRELRTGTYEAGEYRRLWVTIPKRRLVMALPYRDRVVQWAIYLLLNPYFDKRFIEDSYACRVGKGSHEALERLQYWLRKVSRKPGPKWYYLKLDISKYFYRVNHEVLLGILHRHIADEGLMRLLETIVNNDKEPFGLPAGKRPEEVPRREWRYDVGMPIGNLSSQLFANIVLNELDQYAKHKMRLRHYIRYMDDIVILGNDKRRLQAWRDEISAYLRDVLRLELNKKTTIRPISMGIEFVGMRVWATHRIIRKSTVRREKRAVKSIAGKLARGEMSKPAAMRRIDSMRGMMDHAESAGLRWRLNETLLNRAGDEIGGDLPFGRGSSDRKTVRNRVRTE